MQHPHKVKVESSSLSGATMPYKDKEQQRKYQREWMAKRRSDFFADKSCVKCGSSEDLELDHIDPSTKVSHRIWSWSQKKRDEELAKCQILCDACHREKTSAFLDSQIKHGSYKMRNKHGCKCDLCIEFIRWRKQDWRERTGKN